MPHADLHTAASSSLSSPGAQHSSTVSGSAGSAAGCSCCSRWSALLGLLVLCWLPLTAQGSTPNCSSVSPPEACLLWPWGVAALKPAGFPQLPWQASWAMKGSTTSYFLGTATGLDPAKEAAAEAKLGYVGIGWQLDNIPDKFQHLEQAELAQAATLKAVRPGLRVGVTRNTVVACELWDSVRRAVAEYPSYWLQCGTAPCIVPWSTHEPGLKGKGIIPSYLFNFSNADAAAWYVDEYIGSATNASSIDGVYFDAGINASAVVGARLDLLQYEADAQAVFSRAVAAIQSRGKWASGWSMGSEPMLSNETCATVVKRWIASVAKSPNSTFQPATTAFSQIFRHPKPYKGEKAVWPHSAADQNATVAAFMLARGANALLELRVPHGAYWFAGDMDMDATALQLDFGRALGPAREAASGGAWSREFEGGSVALDCASWSSTFAPRKSRIDRAGAGDNQLDPDPVL